MGCAFRAAEKRRRTDRPPIPAAPTAVHRVLAPGADCDGWEHAIIARPDRPYVATLGGLVVAVVSCLVLQVGISRLRIPFPTYAATAIAATVGTVVVAVLVWIAASSRRSSSPAGTLVVPGLLAALVTLWLGLLLQGTHYYLGGISIDQSFRTQALARYAATASLTDMNYLGLPSYYPAGWFWLGGRAADLAGIPAWEFYKLWAILTLAVAAWAAFAAWRFVVSPGRAVLVATATAVIGLGVSSTEPYAWLLVAPMPAVAVIVWRAIRADEVRHRTLALIATGFYLGAAAMTYSLHAGFLGVYVLLAAGIPTRGRAARHLLPRVGRAAVVVVIGLVLALVVWGPFAVAALADGLPRSDAQRYLPYDGAVWSFPMLQPSSVGAMCLVGVIGIVLAWNVRAWLARPLAVLVLLVYAWFALTVPALLVGQTTLAFRLSPIVELVLVCAGVLTAVEALQAVRVRWSDPRGPAARAGRGARRRRARGVRPGCALGRRLGGGGLLRSVPEHRRAGGGGVRPVTARFVGPAARGDGAAVVGAAGLRPRRPRRPDAVLRR